MYTYEDKATLESDMFPGVSFVIRKMTEGARIHFRLAQASAQAQIDDLLVEHKDLVGQSTLAARLRAAAIERDLDRVVGNEANPAWVKWGLVSVDGITINGEPATSDNLAKGPAALYQEVLDKIKAAAHLNGEEIKNSEPLSTSGTQTDGGMKDSSVPPANDPDSTAPEIVPSTSLVN